MGTLVEAVAHQQEAGVVGRVASLFALAFGSVLGCIVEVVVDPLGHLIQGRALEFGFQFLIAYVGGIEDEGERSVDVQQVVHHQAAADAGLGLELLFLGGGEDALVGIADLADDLGEAGDVARAAIVGDRTAVVVTALGLVVGEGALGQAEPGVAPVEVVDGGTLVGGAVEHTPDRAFTAVEVVLLDGDGMAPLGGVRGIAEHQLALEVGRGGREVGRGEGAVDLGVEVLLAGGEGEQGGNRHQGNKYLFHFCQAIRVRRKP